MGKGLHSRIHISFKFFCLLSFSRKLLCDCQIGYFIICFKWFLCCSLGEFSLTQIINRIRSILSCFIHYSKLYSWTRTVTWNPITASSRHTSKNPFYVIILYLGFVLSWCLVDLLSQSNTFYSEQKSSSINAYILHFSLIYWAASDIYSL